MPTHYHVLGSFESASKFAHAFNRAYAVAYNGRYKRRGHVFHSPPSITPVRSRRQLLNTMRYIALNPDDPEAWPHSSYRGLIGVREPFSFVDPKPVLELIGTAAELHRLVCDSRET